MAIKIIRSDITKIKVDAIVNAANESLLGGRGVNGAIHRAAGSQLLEECKMLGGCKVGEAKITNAYELPAKFVIHTVGPVWQGGSKGEEQLLTNCYTNSLDLAIKKGIKTIAFPLISSGVNGYPKDKVLRVAMNVFKAYLWNDIDIFLVLYGKVAVELPESLSSEIDKFIAQKYVEKPKRYSKNYEDDLRPDICACTPLASEEDIKIFFPEDESIEDDENHLYVRKAEKASRKESCNMERQPIPICENMMRPRSAFRRKESKTLGDIIDARRETFSEMLLKLIDQKGMTEVEVYKRANIDRRLFSKIRTDNYYTPSKKTAIALAIALSLNLDETIDFIGRAGYTLSSVLKFDIIIRFFIEKANYDIFEINEVLFAYNLPLLGC